MVSRIKMDSSDIKLHCAVGVLIRFVFSLYSIFHDKFFTLPYTDIDYKVFTFAAKEVIAQRTPYNNPSYRYSPVLAYLMTPNVLVHPVCGKILASLFDVGLAFCIYKVVNSIYNNQKKALLCAQLWLYNPLPIIICTRGNLDSFSSIFILLALSYHLKQNCLASGALLGLSTHLRLYPVIFLFAFMTTAGKFKTEEKFIVLVKNRLKFLAGFVLSMAALTGGFYYVYGPKFLDATIKYHIRRVDPQHNFSLYFYLQYLDAFVPGYITKNFPLLNPQLTKDLLIVVPSFVLTLTVALKYRMLNHLPFSMYCTAFIFVAFNKVLTSQYFIWYLSLLPLFLPSVILSTKKVIAIVSLWVGTQALWLAGAYLLEFKGYDTFIYLHAFSLLFYVVNIWIISTFISSYNSLVVKKVK